MTPLDELQKIGEIEIDNSVAQVVLCRDEGSEEAVANISSSEFSSIATVRYSESPKKRIRLKLLKLEQIGASGNIEDIELLTPDLHRWRQAHADLSWTGSEWSGCWHNSYPQSGKITLRPTKHLSDRRVANTQKCATWSDFKNWATEIRSDFELFRGQGCNSFPLRTSFHRTGRTRLDRFTESLADFHMHAEAASPLGLDLSRGGDLPKILALAQHHGFPTPLLDWTKSPYIAAFFAMADAWENRSTREYSTHTRVYACSKEFVRKNSPSILRLRDPAAYAHFLSVPPSGNARLYAQQGSFLVTNLASVEGFIRNMEELEVADLLCAADIPVSCAAEALEDLSYMGITAATMFPGLDGVARMLKHRLGFSR